MSERIMRRYSRVTYSDFKVLTSVWKWEDLCFFSCFVREAGERERKSSERQILKSTRFQFIENDERISGRKAGASSFLTFIHFVEDSGWNQNTMHTINLNSLVSQWSLIEPQNRSITCLANVKLLRRAEQFKVQHRKPSTILSICLSVQSGLINGIKSSVEFVLFVTSVIRRRDELLQRSYAFDRGRSRGTSSFAHRSRLSSDRRQTDSKPSPAKHTIIQTYDLIR